MITRWIFLLVVAFVMASCQRQEANFESLNLDSQYDYFNPVWSPTGDVIAFVRRAQGAASSDIWVAHQDGTLTNVVPDNGKNNSEISWSPDGKTLVYTSSILSEEYRLAEGRVYLVDVDGNNIRQLAPDVEQEQGSPLWSPDGRYIAFIAIDNFPNTDLWVYDFEQNIARNLTPDIGGAYGVKSWLPGSNFLVAFHVDSTANVNELLQIDIDDGEKIQLVADGGYFDVSPTHTFLVYVPLLQFDVVRYNTDTRTTWQIINTPDIREIAVVISPDSEYILIYGSDISGSKLFIYNTRTYQRSTIVDDLCSVGMTIIDGAWSPDSERFTFVCQDDVNADVWIINRDGSNAINLTGE